MKKILENIREVKPLTHHTHRYIWVKFLFVIFIFLSYFSFVSFRYGVGQGFWVSWITWSIFVMFTPVADAGFLIDFPLRLLFKVRMIVSEIFVWALAIGLNATTLIIYPELYDKTKILEVARHIMGSFWLLFSIAGLSALGTFLSIKFGDELVDVFDHRDRLFNQKHNLKHNILLAIFIFVIILAIYDFLLSSAGIDISEFI